MKKREKMWGKIEEAKAKGKAERGLLMIVAMAFVFSIMYACSPDPVCAKGSRSSSRSSRSYSKPAPRKITQPRRAVKQRIQPALATGAVVGVSAVNHKQNNATTKAPAGSKRIMKKGMYERNGKVCKKTKYGKEKCKSKAAYFFDDVLDADDWFEGDYDENYEDDEEADRQPQQVAQSDGNFLISLIMLLVIMSFMLFVYFVLIRKRK